jgi:phosphoribosylaminoimidazolecarboxamide formyltransferase/IMP cyclohydrolase
MEISFYDPDGEEKRQTLIYEKVTWSIGGEEQGLRYGDNPDQEAVFYRLINGSLTLGGVSSIRPENYLCSDLELLQSGKHPGKINLTDTDNALSILRYFPETPAAVIVKHNNPCGAALGSSPSEAYHRALMADRVAAFGGAVAVNRRVEEDLAELLTRSYCEVLAAPDFSPRALERLSQKKDLRIMQIRNMDRLEEFQARRCLDFQSLIDGGIIAQWSFVPRQKFEDFLPAQCTYQGREYRVNRLPSEEEKKDMLFGWLVESGITSNSVIYVKDGVTIGIGTGEQDRVGVAEIARDKAYRKLADRLAWERLNLPFNLLEDPKKRDEIWEEVTALHGGLTGSVMVSDAFFPFKDGIETGLREGVRGVIQPGGSVRDFEVIESCNRWGASMIFTGQRSFKH